MKKLLLIVATVFVLQSAFCANKLTVAEMESQIKSTFTLDANKDLAITKVVEDLKLDKDRLYTSALSIFTALYGSGESVVEVQDKEQGFIVAKGYFINTDWTGARTRTTHIVRVDVKDNRARIIITLTSAYVTPGSNLAPYEYRITDVKPYGERGMKNSCIKQLYSSMVSALDVLADIESRLKQDGGSDW